MNTLIIIGLAVFGIPRLKSLTVTKDFVDWLSSITIAVLYYSMVYYVGNNLN